MRKPDTLNVFKSSLNFQFPIEIELAARAVNGRQAFTSTVTYAGIPSDGPVSGTEEIPGGPYRILIPTELMQAKVEELITKGVFAALSLNTHDGTTRIGTFTDAWTERFAGTDIEAVKASGFLQRKRDEELVGKVIERARAGELGFSYDMKNTPFQIEEFDGEAVAVLTDFEWRGATVLYRQDAAYAFTQLAAKLANNNGDGGSPDPKSITAKSQDPNSSSTPSTEGTVTSEEELEVTKEELETLLAAQLKPVTDGHR